VQLVRVDELHASPANPRRIAPKRLDQLKRSLVADPLMLQSRPVIALPDGTIVAGNMRWRAAVELGWDSIPTVVVDLDSERARVWMLRDNQSYGDWEQQQLVDLLIELQEAESDLDLTGFDERELQRLLDQLDPDVSPQLPGMTYSILIDCASEAEQRALATRLEADGHTVKLLMA
jgi:ParB-like chromosome segregation protein Spo0J